MIKINKIIDLNPEQKPDVRLKGLIRYIKQGGRLPPIILDDVFLVDGRHRLQAYRKLKVKKVEVIQRGDSLPGGFVRFLDTNATSCPSCKIKLNILKVEPRVYSCIKCKAIIDDTFLVWEGGLTTALFCGRGFEPLNFPFFPKG